MSVPLAAAPPAPAQPPAYVREVVKFCTGFSAGSMIPGGTGPVTVVHTFSATLTTPPGTVAATDISYAEFSSESVTDAGEGVPNLPSSSSTSNWMYVRGRWPIKRTKKLVAASWGTTAILESQAVGGYERHRVYVRKESASTKVRVNLHVNEPPAAGAPATQVDITFAAADAVGTWKYVETFMNVTTQEEGLSSVVTIATPGAGESGSTDWQFVNAIQAFADGAGKDFDTVAFPS